MGYPVYYVEASDTLPHFFDTFDGGDGSSITMSGLAVGDIKIYKDGSMTQRSSTSGFTLIDTDGIDVDAITGIHALSIDLSDNTDSGFYSVGSWYHVIIDSITVDAQTVSFVAFAFRIVSATRGMAGTALPDAAADAAGGLPISDAGGLDLDTQIGTDIDAILADTNELQTDDVPGLIAALNDPTVAAIADGVLDEALSGHTTAGTLGKAVADIETDATAILADTNELQGDDVPGLIAALNDPTAAAVADAVLDEALAGHVTAGTLGKAVADIETDATAILADTNELQTDDVPGLIAALNDISTAQVNTEVDTALADIHLDHLLAADYDPASKPGTATALLNELVESDAGVSRFTTNALENAPGGSSSLPNLLQTTTIATLSSQTSFTLTAGSADDDAYNSQVIVITDQSTSTQKAVGVIQDYTGSTKTVTLSADPGIFTMATGDTVDIIATSPAESAPTAAAIRAEIDANSTQLAAIVADTNELQTDWTNGGRLDLIVDELTTQGDTNETKIDTIDSNVDAVLADTGTTIPGQISGLNDLSAAAVNAEVDTAISDAALATAANLATVDTNVDAILVDTNELQGDLTDGGRLDLLIDAILADTNELQGDDVPGLIAALNDLSAAAVNAEVVDALATDTYAEPTGVPAATTALATKIGYLYMALRNRVDVTASKKTFYDDGDAAEWEKDLSDNGTTYSESEANAI